MSAPHDLLRDVLGPLDGGRIPGGCGWCDAYQVPACIAYGVWVLRVYHDNWCPWLATRKAVT